MSDPPEPSSERRSWTAPLTSRVRAAPARFAGVRHRLPDGAPRVALTFDDGPDPRYTPTLLDLLADHGVVATFFLVGRRAERHPELVVRMVHEGHAVGSHSWSHPDPHGASLRRLREEYRRGKRAVEATTGMPVPLFRPPMGHVAISSAAAAAMARVRPWLWTRDPSDWVPDRTVDDILESLGDLRSGDVILLHDGIELPVSDAALDRSATLGAVPVLIRRAKAAGLDLVTLPPVRVSRARP